ncbi:MAG: VCBS repeat-containing protein [Candidatus Omnitrophica bacterium]|nr:VCBS repeat-containing protein [Candidatus Omnitrophota bacterium]
MKRIFISKIEIGKGSILFILSLFLTAAPSFCIEGEGLGPTLHPGFENGIVIGGGVVQSSLAAEDIDMDGLPELVVGGNEGILYAFNGDGTPVLDQSVENKGLLLPAAIGQLYAPGDGAPILSSPTLADIDSDTRVDIFFGNDAGKVFHLEVVLSTDDAKAISRARSFEKSAVEVFQPRGVSSLPGEEDDLSGR